MRTTVTLSDEVAAEVRRLRREQGMGPSEAIDELARRGLARGSEPQDEIYQPMTHPLGLKVDVTNIGEVLEMLDNEDLRS